jgi:hypothetical protein
MSLLWFGINPWVPELRIPDAAMARPGAPLAGQVHQTTARPVAVVRARRARRRRVRAARRASRSSR